MTHATRRTPELRAFFLALLLLGIFGIRSAQAADCPPLQLLDSIQMEKMGNSWLVPVTIGGKQKKLLLDTGGDENQLTLAAAQDLGLHLRDSREILIDASGHQSNQVARAEGVILGNQKLPYVDFQISTLGFGGMADGLFVPNFNFDVDIDFSTGKLNYISPNHCDGQMNYWGATTLAAVPTERRHGSHIEFDVTVNGKILHAMMDTGASNSVMTLPIATRVFGLTPQSPGMESPQVINDDPALTSYHYDFDTLSFAGVTVNHPRLTIMPDNSHKGGDQGFKIGSVVARNSDDIQIDPVLLGMNILRNLHIYVADKEHKLYISAAADSAQPQHL